MTSYFSVSLKRYFFPPICKTKSNVLCFFVCFCLCVLLVCVLVCVHVCVCVCSDVTMMMLRTSVFSLFSGTVPIHFAVCIEWSDLEWHHDLLQVCRPLLDIGQTGTYALCWILVKQVYVHYAGYWSNRCICTVLDTGQTDTYALCWILVKQVHMHLSVLFLYGPVYLLLRIHSLSTSAAGCGPQLLCFSVYSKYTFTAHFCSWLWTTVTLLRDV